MTDQTTTMPPPRPIWKKPLTIGLACGAVLLAAGAALIMNVSRPDFTDRDPAGARACAMLAAWQRGEITENRMVVSMALSEQAAKSATEPIRAAGGGPIFDEAMMGTLQEGGYTAGNFGFADMHALHSACQSAGADMPPWVDFTDR